MQIQSAVRPPEALRNAIFLDRDGTLNRDNGYVYRPEQFEFIPGALKACRQLLSMEFVLIIVTNQSGIARGYFSERDFQRLTEWMKKQAEGEHCRFEGVYYCPHHPDEGSAQYKKECFCRKPAPGLILRAAQLHRIRLATSYMIGDKLSDSLAGRAAGVGTTILLSSEQTRLSKGDRLGSNKIMQDWSEITDWIEQSHGRVE